MTITEASKEFGLSVDTLRYYERIGLIPHVNKTKSGIRDYDENSCKWIKFAKCMRSAGLPIETLIEYVQLWQQGDQTAEVRKEILVEQRDNLNEKMAQIQATLDRLNEKIEKYETVIIPRMKELK